MYGEWCCRGMKEGRRASSLWIEADSSSSLPLLPSSSSISLRSGIKPLTLTRLDPIVNPNATAMHMHLVVGGKSTRLPSPSPSASPLFLLLLLAKLSQADLFCHLIFFHFLRDCLWTQYELRSSEIVVLLDHAVSFGCFPSSCPNAEAHNPSLFSPPIDAVSKKI